MILIFGSFSLCLETIKLHSKHNADKKNVENIIQLFIETFYFAISPSNEEDLWKTEWRTCWTIYQNIFLCVVFQVRNKTERNSHEQSKKYFNFLLPKKYFKACFLSGKYEKTDSKFLMTSELCCRELKLLKLVQSYISQTPKATISTETVWKCETVNLSSQLTGRCK